MQGTGVGCHAPFQRIFPTQGLNPGLPHCRQILYHLSHHRSPFLLNSKVCTSNYVANLFYQTDFILLCYKMSYFIMLHNVLCTRIILGRYIYVCVCVYIYIYSECYIYLEAVIYIYTYVYVYIYLEAVYIHICTYIYHCFKIYIAFTICNVFMESWLEFARCLNL